MNVRFVWLSPHHEWFGLESVIIFGQRERDAARRQTEQTLWIFIFFLDGRQLYLCAVVKQKRYWFLLQELYTNSKKCTQWELIIETYSSRIFFFFSNKHRLACGACCAEEIEAWLWFHIWHSWVNRELWSLFIVFWAGGKTGDCAMQNGSCFCREWEARGAASSAVLHFNSSALHESFRCGSMAVKCQKKVENFVLLSHIKSINLLKQA